MNRRGAYLRHMGVLVVVAVVGWAVFLIAFQHFFPNSYDPERSRAVVWAWIAGGTAAFVAIMFAVYRIARTPPDWRASAAIAMLAPALVLDAVAATYYLDWFPQSAVHEPTAYAATVVGGAGILQLVAMLYHRSDAAGGAPTAG